MSEAMKNPKLFGFGFVAFKKFPELIPLVAILTVACSAGLAFIPYSLWQKPDVRLVKSTDLPPHERLNPETQQKLFNFDMKYQKIPEVEQLKREIGSYKM